MAEKIDKKVKQFVYIEGSLKDMYCFVQYLSSKYKGKMPSVRTLKKEFKNMGVVEGKIIEKCEDGKLEERVIKLKF